MTEQEFIKRVNEINHSYTARAAREMVNQLIEDYRKEHRKLEPRITLQCKGCGGLVKGYPVLNNVKEASLYRSCSCGCAVAKLPEPRIRRKGCFKREDKQWRKHRRLAIELKQLIGGSNLPTRGKQSGKLNIQLDGLRFLPARLSTWEYTFNTSPFDLVHLG